jgi:PadR family transcriptional regulator PadR
MPAQDRPAFSGLDPSSYLPLTEPTFYILLSLVPGKKHGYAILKHVAVLSDERVSLSTSTLYSALGRLAEQGFIERVASDGAESTGPGLPRKAYALTNLGRRVLEGETRRLQALVMVARLQLGEENL